jgi:hypothetical protein
MAKDELAKLPPADEDTSHEPAPAPQPEPQAAVH